MRLTVRSLASLLEDAGPGDRVFNAMLLGGPFVITSLAIFGRRTVTVAMVGVYLVAFLGYVLYKGST